MDGHRPEPGVVRNQEILALEILRVAVGGGVGGHHLDAPGDGVGDVDHVVAAVGFCERALPVLRHRQTAQAAAAESGGHGYRDLRGVGAQFVFGVGLVMDSRLELGDRDAHVVSLLQERFPVAGLEESPDVVRPGGDGFELAAVGTETRELAGVEKFLRRAVGKGETTRTADFRGIEKPLGEIDPAAGRALELVGH